MTTSISSRRTTRTCFCVVGTGTTEGVSYTYHLTVLNSRHWQFEWTLVGLLDTNAKIIRSPSFSLGKNTWFVQLYPNGDDRTPPSFMSAFINNERGPTQEALFTFIVKGAGDALRLGITKPTVIEEGAGVGYLHFMHHESMKSPGEGFYENDTFKFTVELKIQSPLDDVLRDFADSTALEPNAGILSAAPSTSLRRKANCIICLEKPQTSGFLHDGEYVCAWVSQSIERLFRVHLCVCDACARRLRNQCSRCPLCQKDVDHVVFKIT